MIADLPVETAEKVQPVDCAVEPLAARLSRMAIPCIGLSAPEYITSVCLTKLFVHADVVRVPPLERLATLARTNFVPLGGVKLGVV